MTAPNKSHSLGCPTNAEKCKNSFDIRCFSIRGQICATLLLQSWICATNKLKSLFLAALLATDVTFSKRPRSLVPTTPHFIHLFKTMVQIVVLSTTVPPRAHKPSLLFQKKTAAPFMQAIHTRTGQAKCRSERGCSSVCSLRKSIGSAYLIPISCGTACKWPGAQRRCSECFPSAICLSRVLHSVCSAFASLSDSRNARIKIY
jgi:hypothetical protein